jgi:hypothetical protein
MIAYIVALILLCISPIAFATTQTIIVKQDVADANNIIASGYDAWQLFKIPQKCKIEIVELYVMKTANLTGFTLGFYYWNTSANTLGDKIYEQDFTSIPTTYTKTNYTLSTPVQLNVSASTYALYLKPYGGTESDTFNQKISTNNPYSGGTFWVYIWPASQEKPEWDLYFVLYGQLIADPVSIVYEFLPVIILIAMLGVALGMFKDLQK